MKVSNIDLDQLLDLLNTIKAQGNVMVDIELSNKGENGVENKDSILIYPIKIGSTQKTTNNNLPLIEQETRESDITILDPSIDLDDNSIYNMFDNVS